MPDALDGLKALYRQVAGEHPDWDDFAARDGARPARAGAHLDRRLSAPPVPPVVQVGAVGASIAPGALVDVAGRQRVGGVVPRAAPAAAASSTCAALSLMALGRQRGARGRSPPPTPWRPARTARRRPATGRRAVRGTTVITGTDGSHAPLGVDGRLEHAGLGGHEHLGHEPAGGPRLQRRRQRRRPPRAARRTSAGRSGPAARPTRNGRRR